MVEIGYKLSSEEHRPQDLVHNAQRAEAAGFPFALISDHYHPWIDRQGQAPFVWAVIGGLAQVTKRMRIGTAVTCPIIRTHPAIIAQAAATAAAMLPRRFMFGVGSGENLNEHVVGQRWPTADVRRDMLEEAVEVIRLLWQGGQQDHRGRFFTVENARLYTLPDEPPPIFMAASGELAAETAGRLGDGLIATAPKAELVKKFEAAGGRGKPRYVEMSVCWARDEAQARRTAHEWWPNAAVKGELSAELPLPRHFEQAAGMVDEAAVAEEIICGPDPERHIGAIRKHVEAGFDHVCVHQVGPDQQGFIEFYERQVLPTFSARDSRAA